MFPRTGVGASTIKFLDMHTYSKIRQACRRIASNVAHRYGTNVALTPKRACFAGSFLLYFKERKVC